MMWSAHLGYFRTRHHSQPGLHVFELIHPPLRVSFPHFPQSLVFVSALLDIFPMDLVHGGLLL